jgi:hypothetical protein
MMSYLLSLQRASWTWRVAAFVILVITISQLKASWGYLHDDLSLVRSYGWMVFLLSAWMFCVAFLVGVVGRVPKSLARRRGGLNRTLSHIHADLAEEQPDQRKKSHKL